MAVASSQNGSPAKLVCRAASFSSGLETAAGPGPGGGLEVEEATSSAREI